MIQCGPVVRVASRASSARSRRYRRHARLANAWPRSGRGSCNGPGAHRSPTECRACDEYNLAARGTARALCDRARSRTEAVRLSCLQRTPASPLNAGEMGVRLASLGPWVMQRAWGQSLACRAQAFRPVLPTIARYRARALCDSVRSRRGDALVVLAAHSRVAAEGTQHEHALGLASTVAYSTGLGPTARLPSSRLAAGAVYQRVVPRARSLCFSAVS